MLDETPDLDNPDYWLLTLGRRMRKRSGQLDQWWDYYRGRPPLPQLPKKEQAEFQEFQRKARTNFCGLISNATVHRVLALGVTNAAGEPDAAAARWWQLNKLASRQKLVWRSTMAQSVGYMLVGEHPTRVEADGGPSPLITAESPRECITENDPETGEPLVGIKAWHNPIDGYGRVRVFFDDVSFRYRTKERCTPRLPWGPDSWLPVDGDTGQAHDLGLLPLVPFLRAPDLDSEPEPEFAGVLDVQDRVNLGILNRMNASRHAGFPQKWIKGHKFTKRKDPESGLVTVENPFVSGPGNIWASEGEEAAFGQYPAADLTGFLREHEADVRDMLVLSQTPAYYYANDLVNISADTVQALDVLHVAKVKEHIYAFQEGLEDVTTLAARVAGSDQDYTEAVVRFADPRSLNPAVLADSATKLKSIGYPLDVIAEEMGETPERVRRIKAGAASDALLAASLLPAPTAPTAGNTGAVDDADDEGGVTGG